MRFSLDIDGVVADFNGGIAALARRLGMPPLEGMRVPSGEHAVVDEAVMTELLNERAQRLDDWIDVHLEEFWGELRVLATPEDRQAISRARGYGHELFWLSSRPSSKASDLFRITQSWLHDHDFPGGSHHLRIVPHKDVVIRGEGIAAHLDDSVAVAAGLGLRTEADIYLIRRPWNSFVFEQTEGGSFEARIGAFNFPTVASIADYIDLIIGERKADAHGPGR